MYSNKLTWVVASAVILVVALVYWPVVHANFVWIDWTDFHDRNWLREGDYWKHFIFRDFNGWTNYFRPLVVGFFTLQVRLFNTMPGPMHAVSLCLHLANTLLVGVLAWRHADAWTSRPKRLCLLGVVMLLYGLHPVLIEPVAWIGCQFELLVTMFTLLSLLASLSIRNSLARAAVLALLFFLAACTKESAVSLPLIVVAFDWLHLPPRSGTTPRASIRHLLNRNWPTYAAILLAGIAYLVLRHWALGSIVNPFPPTTSSAFARLQEVCFLYLHYWRTLAWPMSGMNPIHLVDTARFNAANLPSVLTDLASTGMILAGLILALRRRSALGVMVLAVTAALLPVLHVASMDFDPSLYHERYAMTALAIACILLPRIRPHLPDGGGARKLAAQLLGVVLLFWLAFAVANIRATLPLWANNMNLWRWVLVENPRSVDAMNNLLSAYIDARDYPQARTLIDRVQSQQLDCVNCMLNAAILAIAEQDPARASAALEIVRHSRKLTYDKDLYHLYLLATGRVLIMQGQLDDAVQVLRVAKVMAPYDPQPQLWLAMALALQGKQAEALAEGQPAIAASALTPEERTRLSAMLDAAVASGLKSARRPAQAPAKR
ncbi:tetratricopeptide repeat protein [Rhodanobacter sp. DHB23]|uniref:tetratricopeptide repeat protein n=1 Tax=Rhodanobacter sp. DHB23 TaxID=2775923 RepID=UPI00177F2A5A|nr:tetratricopeptide repeat protein [Rhodanobacter sp. DHB23]MBD8873112.1 hypothetical protein [Rhodanobacter sp. DHB23]